MVIRWLPHTALREHGEVVDKERDRAETTRTVLLRHIAIRVLVIGKKRRKKDTYAAVPEYLALRWNDLSA